MPRPSRSRAQLLEEEKKKKRREQLSIRRARAKMTHEELEERRRRTENDIKRKNRKATPHSYLDFPENLGSFLERSRTVVTRELSSLRSMNLHNSAREISVDIINKRPHNDSDESEDDAPLSEIKRRMQGGSFKFLEKKRSRDISFNKTKKRHNDSDDSGDDGTLPEVKRHKQGGYSEFLQKQRSLSGGQPESPKDAHVLELNTSRPQTPAAIPNNFPWNPATPDAPTEPNSPRTPEELIMPYQANGWDSTEE